MIRVAVAAAFLVAQLAIYHFVGENDVIPPRRTFASFPLTLGDWRCSAHESLDAKIEEQLGLTDYLVCDYRRSNDEDAPLVNAYVGYNEAQYREGAGSRARSSIHPPEHCMPGAGWDIIQAERVHVDPPGLPDREPVVNRLVIAKGEARQLVYYWYQSRGRVIADPYRKIAYLFLDRATRQRADGSLVRVTIPIRRGDEERADEAFRDFLPGFARALPAYLPD